MKGKKPHLSVLYLLLDLVGSRGNFIVLFILGILMSLL